ncbi:PREDICTED: bifunctional coenzyme A synthase [Acromyrmex echinatior]|uniref:Bifunctional coenzyme A synthase n=1 Tax=Acromyrmex echinatior TaxID=103372 RepID=F4W8X3_ACREC|nr:PREDICTED: bifunctional coenzyme A synthase [Acromyrmex echinatior]EGI69332.1 Bifunctional coenzyme A synthase [Acromyrmex echinatior]
MANTGLLVLTNPAKMKGLLFVIQKYVLETLYIQYLPGKNIFAGNYKPTTLQQRDPEYSKKIIDIYKSTSTISSCIDIRVLLTNLKYPNRSIINTKKPVEVVIFDQKCSKEEADTFIQGHLANKSLNYHFVNYICSTNLNCCKNVECDVQKMKTYKNVILGGTFDRLHNGHKIMLSEAVLRCTEKLTVGVTDINMITGKVLWELIQSCTQRITKVEDFLEDVDSSLSYNVVPINDIYGPTKEDPTLEMIVVSEETKRGGDKINELRLQKDLNKLDMHVVELAGDEDHEEHEEAKISSSNRRMRLLGTRLKDPSESKILRPRILRPYVIGLTGGIASGKSSVAEKLQQLGAGLVNCDKLAHNLYLPGTDCFHKIIEHFGSFILDSDGFINRKLLGDIVFNNKEQLEKLNKLIWPLILQEAKKEIENLFYKHRNIIVLEAAVLIQAEWQNECSEIWTCIIPQNEAIKRIMNRNGLSEEAAKLRINTQPSTMEQVKEANVVICTLWSYERTLVQVERAWKELTQDLNKLQAF